MHADFEDPMLRRLANFDESLAQGDLKRQGGESSDLFGLPPALRGRARCIQLLRSLGGDRSASADITSAVADLEDHRTPLAIGRFEILREIGRGGFGLVYLAYDPMLRRNVALKVPRPDALLDDRRRDRVLREFRAAARLRHPNIVRILEAGAIGPVVYSVSDYCPGPTLGEWLQSRSTLLPPADAGRLLEPLADALGYAHANGILHRDLKPANVLMDASHQDRRHSERGTPEKNSLPRPMVIDFGLAKLMDAEEHTATDAILGTPRYMSPEQAAANSKATGPATDVHALGVILYEMLCGRPPYLAPTSVETIRAVCDATPIRPRKLQSGIPRDLEVICLKCLEKAPEKRYSSGLELAEDLRRFLEGKSIKARPASALERCWRWARRRPAAAALVAGSIVLPLTFAASYWRIHAANRRQMANVHLNRFFDAEPRSLAAALNHVVASGDLLKDELRAAADEGPDAEFRARAALALAHIDPAGVPTIEEAGLLASIADLPELLGTLTRRPADADRFEAVFADPVRHRQTRLRAAGIAVQLGRRQFLNDHRDDLVEMLLDQPTPDLQTWSRMFWPIRESLIPVLTKEFEHSGNEKSREAAAAVLSQFQADNAAALAALLAKANLHQFEWVYSSLARRGQLALEALDSLQQSSATNRASEDGRMIAELANLAVAAIRLDPKSEEFERRLGADADPSVRFETIRRIRKLGVDPTTLMERLCMAKSDGVRYATALALAGVDLERCDASLKDRLRKEVRRLWTSNPDPGVHSACEWLLKRWNLPLQDAEDIPPAEAHKRGLRWHREGGQTFAWILFPNSATAKAGSREVRAGDASTGKDSHAQGKEPEPELDFFCIAARETTRREYNDFLRATGEPAVELTNEEIPVADLTFAKAAQYCNWRSKSAGMADDDLVYEISESSGRIAAKERPDWRKRRGFRLPTVAELAYACRAGSAASTFAGDDPSRLEDFCWSIENSQSSVRPVGMLAPNPFGLFDTLGNVEEWCSPVASSFQGYRARRGGSFRWQAKMIDATVQFAVAPEIYDRSIGFRIARMLIVER